MQNNLSTLTTEMRNDRSATIDNMNTLDIIETINKEDREVAQKVQDILPAIKETVDAVYHAMRQGGKLFYIGAGTSGRLGILDAVECPPTFSTPSDLVQGIIAGGDIAFRNAVEGAEDDPDQGAKDLKSHHVTELDVVIGITSSGRTPYVIGALEYANKAGAKTISLSSNENAVVSDYADIKMEVITGPEVLTCSTRMKAASAHKMILNMITTSSMIKIGKVYENLMVDVKVSNYKLKERAKSIIKTITGASYEKTTRYLNAANNEVKPAIVMINTGVSYEEAKKFINVSNGFVRQAIQLEEKMNK